jgi:hypothetical protein
MTMPTVAQAQAVYDDFEALSLGASEAVDRVRTQVALGQATESALNKALKAEQTAIQRRKTAEAGLQAAKLAARAAAEEERQEQERIKHALVRRATEELATIQVATVTLLTRHLAELASLEKEYAAVQGVIGRTAGIFAPNLPIWHEATACLAKILDIIEPIAARVGRQS